MPSSLTALVELLDLEQLDADTFRGTQPDTALQRVFGGQVAAQALMAAAATVPTERSVHSLHGYFLRAGDTAVPITYAVGNLRDGRSFSSRRVFARQHGEVIFAMVASFQAGEQGLTHADPAPDGIRPPEQCPELADVFAGQTGQPRERWDAEWAALDVRLARRSPTTFWVRAAGDLPDDPVLHTGVLTYLSDLTLLGASLVPHDLYLHDRRVKPASLDHAVWFHRPIRVDEWLLYAQHSPFAGGGRGFALGQLYTESGDLVVSTAQEGVIRFRPDSGSAPPRS